MRNEETDSELEHPQLRLVIFLIFGSVILSGILSLLFFGINKSFLILLSQVCLIAPALLYIRYKNYNIISVFRLYPVDRDVVIASALLGPFLSVLIDEFDRIVSQFIQLTPEQEALLSEYFVAQNGFDWLVLILSVVVIAGIGEEMLFRGLLQQALERRRDYIYAILFSALAFALVHPYPWFLQVIAVGCILGYVSWRANSIIPCIILHAINNSFSLIFTNFEATQLSWYEWYGHVHPTVIAVAACVVFYAFKWFLNVTVPPAEKTNSETT